MNGPTDTQQALTMLDAFQSVGVRQVQATILDIDENKRGFETRSLAEFSRHLSSRLEDAARKQLNVIVRPEDGGPLLVQLDDLDRDKAKGIAPHGFLTVETSPGNYQVWVAVSDGPQGDEPQRQFRKRLRKGAGADTSATGAVRLAGSLNVKHKYAPDFPVVTVRKVQAGKTVTTAELESLGLLAAPEAVTPPPVFHEQPKAPKPRADAPRSWPDYNKALAGAPLKKGGGGPDRSLADFMWAKWAAERGWLANEIAPRLCEVSDKAKERAGKGDHGYAQLTAKNAVATVQRDRGNRQHLKSPLRHEI